MTRTPELVDLVAAARKRPAGGSDSPAIERYF